jgi:hypothetical protein
MFNLTFKNLKNIFFFIDKKNMMLEKPYYWDTNQYISKGDALWRTSIAYIAYKNKKFKEAILSCFKFKDNKLQVYRYPEEGFNKDTSRDQITMALVALKYNNDIEDLKGITDNLKWKLSEKFNMTLDMWLWIKSLQKNSKIYSILFIILSFIILSLNQLWNKALYKWSNLIPIDPEIHKSYGIKQATKKQITAMKLHYPMYAFHLFAWQYYTLPSNLLKKVFGKYCSKFVEPTNYLLKILFGIKIPKELLENYKPMTGMRWQNNFFLGLYNSTEIIKDHKNYYHIDNTLNVLDKDILYRMYLNNVNNIG